MDQEKAEKSVIKLTSKDVVIVLLAVICGILLIVWLNHKPSKSLRSHEISRRESLFDYPNNGVIHEDKMTQVVLDSVEIDPDDSDKFTLVRDTFYILPVINQKTRDSAKHAVPVWADSARTIPVLDTQLVYPIPKEVILPINRDRMYLYTNKKLEEIRQQRAKSPQLVQPPKK